MILARVCDATCVLGEIPDKETKLPIVEHPTEAIGSLA
jgi:hypothetical protein